MPRQARLDAAGTLHYIIIRGINAVEEEAHVQSQILAMAIRRLDFSVRK